MPKRKPDRRPARKKSGRKGPAARRATGRARTTARPSRATPKHAAKRAKRKAPASKTRRVTKMARPAPKAKPVRKARRMAKKPSAVGRPRRPLRAKPPHLPPERLDRPRRVLDDGIVQTPPSSLNMDRHGSAVRTGRAEMAEHLADHATLTPSIAAGDLDVNIEDAYFSGDEAPGGDNSTPDQDIVDDIGKALGVEYQDDEELQSGDKVSERDKHRWELDPASSEDYGDRKE